MPLSETTRQVIDEEVERMIAEAYGDAITLAEEHRAELVALAVALLAHDDLDRGRIAELLGSGRPRPRADLDLGPRTEPALRRQHEPARPAEVVPLERPRRRLVPSPAAAAAALRGALGRRARPDLAPAKFRLPRRAPRGPRPAGR